MPSSYAILDVIPHGKPMSLLDEVLTYNNMELEAGLTIREDSLFFDGQAVPAWVGIEYMGQAVAAFAGVGARVHDKPVKIGFLVSSRRYRSNCDSFPLGVCLKVTVRQITDNESGLRVFECSITGDGIRVDTNLNVYMPDDIEAFLRGDQ